SQRRSVDIPANRWRPPLWRQFTHQLALELHRRAIAKRGVTSAWVVKALQVFKHGELRLRLGVEAMPIEQLTLQRSEETLGHGVVMRITDRSDRRHDAHFPTAFAEGKARVLAAALHSEVWVPVLEVCRSWGFSSSFPICLIGFYPVAQSHRAQRGEKIRWPAI